MIRMFAGAALVVAAVFVNGYARPAHAADAALIAAAEKEGVVNFYSSSDAVNLLRPLSEAFTKKYPKVKVALATGGAGDLILRIQNEAKAGKLLGDVITGGSAAATLRNGGLVEPYRPESASAYNAQYKEPGGYWTATALLINVTAVNTELVKLQDAPRTYADLLDPKWRGKMIWTSAPVQGGPWGLIYTVLDTMGEKDGMDYLQKLSAQKIVNLPANARTVLDQVISGAYPVALMAQVYDVVAAKKAGAPVEWIKMEPIMAIVNTVTLIKNSPNQNAGKLLIDFIASAEGQQIFKNSNNVTVHPNVAPDHPSIRPDTGGYKAIVQTPEQYAEATAKLNKIYADLFK